MWYCLPVAFPWGLYVEQILASLGAYIHIRAVAVKPGKPLTVATFSASGTSNHKQVLYFGLPGNPVSARKFYGLCNRR